jgi:hypothetical protein
MFISRIKIRDAARHWVRKDLGKNLLYFDRNSDSYPYLLPVRATVNQRNVIIALSTDMEVWANGSYLSEFRIKPNTDVNTFYLKQMIENTEFPYVPKEGENHYSNELIQQSKAEKKILHGMKDHFQDAINNHWTIDQFLNGGSFVVKITEKGLDYAWDQLQLIASDVTSLDRGYENVSKWSKEAVIEGLCRYEMQWNWSQSKIWFPGIYSLHDNQTEVCIDLDGSNHFQKIRIDV